MNTVLGVFAHVDAGKTSFCESLLYQTGALNKPGSVDDRQALLDYNAVEQERGITVFCDMAEFTRHGRTFQLIDTPGHVDFSAEMERTLSVLDAAVLVVSGTDGVQSHTTTVFSLLREHNIPVYIFLNKMDLPGADNGACLREIRERLTPGCRFFTLSQLETTETAEWLCELDDCLLERYIENGVDPKFLRERLRVLVKIGAVLCAGQGSARFHTGVLELLDVIEATLESLTVSTDEPFGGRVFKVRYDEKGERVTFLRVMSGTLRQREEICHKDGSVEKIHEIRRYQGGRYETVKKLLPGEIGGVTGPRRLLPGMGVGICEDLPAPMLRPALRASVQAEGCDHSRLMRCLHRMEEQDPQLQVEYQPETRKTGLCVMGKIQLEVLQAVLSAEQGLEVTFGPCQVVYQETIKKPVMGFGHYEPLRHYAEVHLRMEPNPGGGLEFISELHTDVLARQIQNLIRQTVLTEDHRGVLTGSRLNDVRFVLTAGAVHLKHTEGGDIREATCRAIRQGLEKAESQLLEPYYDFQIEVTHNHTGRILTDIIRRHGIYNPPQSLGRQTRITGRGPVVHFLEYSAELLTFTHGEGSISQRFSGYHPCQNESEVIAGIGYERERDLRHTSSSVFCKRGAGYEVKWFEAEQYMHIKSS